MTSLTDFLKEETFSSSFKQNGIQTQVKKVDDVVTIKAKNLELIYDPKKFQEKEYVSLQLESHLKYKDIIQIKLNKLNSLFKELIREENQIEELLESTPISFHNLILKTINLSSNLIYLPLGTTFKQKNKINIEKTNNSLSNLRILKNAVDYGKNLLEQETNKYENLNFWLETQKNISEIYFKSLHVTNNLLKFYEREKKLFFPNK